MNPTRDRITEANHLFQQGKFLVVLWILIAVCIVYYFFGLQHKSAGSVAVT